MMERDGFLEARKSGLGGSDIGAVIGVSPYKSALDVYYDKVEPKTEQEHNELFYWGHALEKPVGDRFIKDHPDFEVIRDVPLAFHPNNEWMLANVDGLFDDDKGQRGILEIKTVNAFAADDWGLENSDEVPLAYACQVAHYMAVMDADYAIVAALFGGNSYKEFRIERDLEIEHTIIQRGGDFWNNNVIARVPPEPVTADDVARLFKRDLGTVLVADDNILTLCQEIKRLKTDAKELDSLISELTVSLKKIIGDAATVNYAGYTICSWQNNKDSQKVNYEKAVNDFISWLVGYQPPNILMEDARIMLQAFLSQNTKTVPGLRPLLIK
jgi:putative phage-type endonuclease